jgi:isopentenyldiphosphate isomerase
MQEIIDVCDSNGNYTGQKLLRSEIHKNKLWHRTTHVQILDFDRRALFQLRSAEKEAFPNKLDISAAGHVSSGEKIITAALRELEEELCLQLEESRLEYMGDFASEQTLPNGDVDREIQSFFIAKITESEKLMLKIQESEVQKILWFTGQELEQALRENPDDFAPNEEEYALILGLLSQTPP